MAPADFALDGGPTLAMDPRWLTEAGRAQLPAQLLNAPWARLSAIGARHFTHVIDAHGGLRVDRRCARPDAHRRRAGLDVYRVD